MIIIGLSGWKGSGKDTVGNFLRYFGYMRVAYADTLKINVCNSYNLTRDHCEDRSLKEAPLLHLPVFTGDAGSMATALNYAKEFATETGEKMGKNDTFFTDDFGSTFFIKSGQPERLYWTPRALMIMEGTTKRSVHQNYWVDQAILKINAMSKDFKDFYISDLRYKSEASRMKEEFGNQFIAVRVNRFNFSSSDDASERDMDDYQFDYVIDNNLDIPDLQRKVDALARQIHGY